MKAYKRMRAGENLSWCRPYRSGNNYYVQNEGEIIQLMQDGTDLVIDKDTLRIVEECDDWEEIGCAECPWRDECEAMNEDVDDFSDDDLAEIVRDADDWTEPDCMEAMQELCNRAGNKLRAMVRDGIDCSEHFKALRYSDWEYLEGTPDVSYDTTDIIDWLWHEAADRAESIHLCYALENILDIDLGL